MRPGVYDRVAIVVVRQIRIIGLAIECELEDTHARKVKFVAERVHVGRDQPQILGDKRESAQFPLQCMKEIGAWTRDPLSRLRRRCPGRNVPRRCECAEMIQPDYIDVGQQGLQSGN